MWFEITRFKNDFDQGIKTTICTCPWLRNDTDFAELLCDKGMDVDFSAPQCQPNCIPTTVYDTCQDRRSLPMCVCPPPLVLQGDRCVEESQCGCVENGYYYSVSIHYRNVINSLNSTKYAGHVSWHCFGVKQTSDKSPEWVAGPADEETWGERGQW